MHNIKKIVKIMTKKSLLISLILVAFVGIIITVVLFIFSYKPTQTPETDETGSSQQGINEVVSANNRFAFDLFSQLNKSDKGNIFYSPYSIFTALATTYEGARMQTADEIKSVFHFPENNILRPNSAAIYNHINKKDKPYKLNTGNALWVQKNYKLLDKYLSTVEKYYGGKVANLDFSEKAEKSRQTINAFIEGKTANRIKDLIPAGFLDASTKLVLTNAIYFKGTWVWEFDKADTREEDFMTTPTNAVKTPMMYLENDKAKFSYADVGDLQILELPYKGNDISMLILLPTENLNAIEPSLTIEKLKVWKNQMKEEKLDSIYLPKFKFDTKYYMAKTLSNMGMPSAFDNADFSGINGYRDLFIDEVIHQAFIEVDEKGTEAAGATTVSMQDYVALPRTVFNANHPFLFVIQEKETGNILFLGRVSDPTK